MQFRCYTCGFVFRDGPPPLEALSDQQLGLVAGSRSRVEEVRLALLGTKLEGLGAPNFCDPCLLAILDNPAAWVEGAAEGHTLQQNLEAIWCECGVTFWTSDGPYRRDLSSEHPRWEEINRLKMRHLSDTLSART